MEWSLFMPLVLAGVAFAALTVAAGVAAGRDNQALAERIRDVGFLVVLAAAAWTVVLVLVSIFSEPDEIWDMVSITLVIAAFFAVLLVVFFGLALLFGAIGRAFSRRKRVTTPGA
jgi:hypothetical protein